MQLSGPGLVVELLSSDSVTMVPEHPAHFAMLRAFHRIRLRMGTQVDVIACKCLGPAYRPFSPEVYPYESSLSLTPTRVLETSVRVSVLQEIECLERLRRWMWQMETTCDIPDGDQIALDARLSVLINGDDTVAVLEVGSFTRVEGGPAIAALTGPVGAGN